MEQVKITRQGIGRPTLVGLVILVVIGAVCALYVMQRDHKASEEAAITNAATTMDPHDYIKRVTNPDVVYKLDIKDKKVDSGPTHITVQKGQSVNIDFTTPGDSVDVELEGYGIITETDNVQAASGGFHFIADKRGTFKFFIPSQESEHAEGTNGSKHDIQLGTVTVK